MSCGVCVGSHDHHCPFIGTCIGAGNYRPFLLMIAMITTAVLPSLGWSCWLLAWQIEQAREHALGFGLAALGLLSGGFTGFLCCAHCGLVYKGLTTRQFWLEAYRPTPAQQQCKRRCKTLSCCILSTVCCMTEQGDNAALRVDLHAASGRPGISACGKAAGRPRGCLSLLAVCCYGPTFRLPPLRARPWDRTRAQEYYAALAVAQHASLPGDAAWWPANPPRGGFRPAGADAPRPAAGSLPVGAGTCDQSCFRQPPGGHALLL